MKKAGRQHKSQNRFRCKVVATAVAACFVADIAYANPTGPVVLNGQVSFSRAGSVLSVTNSPSSIINWQQFSIAGGETTRFIQQSAASAVLNRVVGVDPSSILGTLQSNGRVFLINPSGIMFGAGSQIDVAGLVASTLRLSNEDFLAGRMNFVADPAHAAAVVNQGRISASPGGQVYLVGTAIDNQGVITAPNGDIVLAAGNSVRVTDGTGSRLQVEIRAPADSTVNLSEAVYGSRGIYGGLVRNSGNISANSVVRTADGRIVLKASGDVTLSAGSSTTANGAGGGTVSIVAGGTASVSGAVEAKGDAGAGGRVEISGDLTGIFDGARVNASGTTGGGTVLVGGDYQGSNPEVQNAERTYVGPNVEIRADALESGDGGRVIVWADDVTRYFGNISARGGAQSGNGGFVEVSGHESLIFRGTVDASAPKGLPGRVLLDPKDIIIADLGPDPAASANNEFADNPTGTVTIDESAIEAIIVAGTAVTLQANNDITVSEAITLATSAGTDGTLTLQAGRSVLINQGITGTDGALVIRANSTVADGVVDANRDAGAAVITMANGVTINTGTGNITLAMGTGPTTNNVSGDITISNLTTTGSVLVSQGGQTAGSSILRTGTSLVTAATVALDVSDAANNTGVIGTTGSRIATTAANLEARTQGGDIFITETNALVIGGAALGGLTGINAGTGNVTLAAGGTVTQTEAITAGTLTLEGAGRTFTLNTQNNAITTLDANNTALAALSFKDDSGFDVAGINATGAVTLNSVGGTVTQSGAIAATTLTLTGAGGTFTLSGAGNAITTLDANNAALAALSFKEDSGFAVAGINTTGNTTLESAGGTVTQTAAITAPTLTLQGAGSTFTLSGAGNAITTLDADNTALTALNFREDSGFDVAGINATGAVTLNSVGGTVTQTGAIAATTLTLTGVGGNFTLNGTGNAITTLDANNAALTTLSFKEDSGFAVAGINATGAMTLDSAGAVTQTAIFSGAGTLTKQGSGTLTLSLANTYTGTTTINAGTLAYGASNVIATGAVAVDGAAAVLNLGNNRSDTVGTVTVANGGSITGTGTSSLTSTGSFEMQDGSVSAILAGAGIALNKTTGGTVTLSGANSYTGTTTVSVGTLVASNNSALGGTAAGTTVASGATLEITNGTAIGAEALNLSGAGVGANGALVVTSGNGTFGGAITLGASASIGGNGGLTLGGTVEDIAAGTSTLTQAGSGTLTFSNTVGATNALAAVTTSPGQTTAINGGTVRTTGAQTYGGTVTSSAGATLTSTGGGNITANDISNNFSGNLALSTSGDASIVDSNALALGASTVGTLIAQTLTGDLTLNGAITTTSTSADAVTLIAAVTSVPDATGTGGNFKNPGSSAITTGVGGAWRIYTGNPTNTTRGGLVEAGKRYNVDDGSDPIASGNRIFFRIQPTLTVTADAGQGKVYGNADPVLTYATSGTLIDGDATFSPTGSLTRAVGETVAGSPYSISVGTLSSQLGYTLNFAGDNFAITTRPITVTADAQTKVYGANDPALSFVVGGSGLANNAGIGVVDSNATVFSGVLARAAGETVVAPGPTYAINQGTLAANANYSVTSFTPDNLTITPAPLSVTADDATRPVNQPNPSFSASYSGFQFGETPAAMTGTLSFSTTATIPSPVGSYPITPFGQSSTNYAVTYVDGNLAVTSGAPVVPSQPPASNPDPVTNLVVGSLQQLKSWCVSPQACPTADSGGSTPRGPLLVLALGERVAPPLMETGAGQPAPDVTESLALRPALELAANPGPRTPKYNDVMTAVMRNDPSGVTELLELGWWVDRRDSNGLTPLMVAALNGDAAMTQLLLSRGADPNQRARDMSVLDYATRGGDGQVIELLRRAGAR